jgi:hypothetical protein
MFFINRVLTPVAIANGDFETLGTGTGTPPDVFASWTEGRAGTSVVSANSTDPYSGSNSARFTMDASGSIAQIAQATTLTIGKRYRAVFFARSSVDGVKMNIGRTATDTPLSLTTAWTQYWVEFTADSTTLTLKRNSAVSVWFEIDNVVIYELS